jgi:hypothetical protein
VAQAGVIPAGLSPSVGNSVTSLAPTVIDVFDEGKAVESRRWDVTSGHRGQEIAVAVLTARDEAYAWGAESQRFREWDNPEWKLDQPGRYDVTVRLDASGVEKSETFELEVGAPGSQRLEWAASAAKSVPADPP